MLSVGNPADSVGRMTALVKKMSLLGNVMEETKPVCGKRTDLSNQLN